jgi:hypothetical protein
VLADPYDHVTVSGGPEVDTLGVARDGSAVVVSDPAGVSAGEGCSAVDAVTARCELKGMGHRLALDAGPGADAVTVTAPFASETIKGGDGDDRLEDRAPGAVFDGGAGADTIIGGGRATASYADRSRAVTVTLGRDVPQGEPAEGDRLAGIASVQGGSGPDRLTALARGGSLAGGPGADTLSAAPGGSDLRGEAGADVLRGGRGADTLAGGAGSDRVHGGGGGDALFGGSGLQAEGAYDPAPGDDGVRRDRDVLAGGAGDDLLATGPGRDTLDGGSGADALGVKDAGLFGGDLVLGPGDRARARDRSRDVVRCHGRKLVVAADAGDVTLGCRAGLRRTGRPRPGFSGPTDLELPFSDGTLFTDVGCPDDMPRRCRFAYRVFEGRRLIGDHAGSARRGREASPDVRLDRAALRRAACRGRVAWRLEVRTRTATGARLTLRRALRGSVDRDPAACRPAGG